LSWSPRKKVFSFYYRLGFVTRAVVAMEKRFEISHLFHGFSNRCFLPRLSSPNLILTAATGGEIQDVESYQKFKAIVVETDSEKERAIAAGICPSKLRLIPPGVDDRRFSYRVPEQNGRFTVLFASAPLFPGYFRNRGIELLLQAALASKDVEFLFLWRRHASKMIRERTKGLPNVKVLDRIRHDMNGVFANVHATVAPYLPSLTPNTKPAPNSLIESLAAGKPVLASTSVGIAPLIEQEACRVVFEPTVEGLCAAVDELRSNYDTYQGNSRPVCERFFSREKFLQEYQQLYDEVLRDGCLRE